MMGDRIGIPHLGRLDDSIMSSNAPMRHLGKPVGKAVWRRIHLQACYTNIYMRPYWGCGTLL